MRGLVGVGLRVRGFGGAVIKFKGCRGLCVVVFVGRRGDTIVSRDQDLVPWCQLLGDTYVLGREE